MPAHLNPSVRHTAFVVIEAVNSNPNGDPDADNRPRVDYETGHGIISDVSIKRKVRDYAELAGQPLFISATENLNNAIDKVAATVSSKGKPTKDEVNAALCQAYFDVRMFGAVASTGSKVGGTIRGPVQISAGSSIDPILPMNMGITRVVQTKDGEEGGTIGRKWIVPYAVYVAQISYDPHRGEATGISAEDLELLWSGLLGGYQISASASRPQVNVRALYVFSHDSKLGNAADYKLAESIVVNRVSEGPARKFSDYTVAHGGAEQFPGITFTSLG